MKELGTLALIMYMLIYIFPIRLNLTCVYCRVVESIGEGVRDLKEGDLVIPACLGECQECENCTSGKTNLCLKYPLILNGLMPDGTSRMSINGQKLYQLFT